MAGICPSSPPNSLKRSPRQAAEGLPGSEHVLHCMRCIPCQALQARLNRRSAAAQQRCCVCQEGCGAACCAICPTWLLDQIHSACLQLAHASVTIRQSDSMHLLCRHTQFRTFRFSFTSRGTSSVQSRSMVYLFT